MKRLNSTLPKRAVSTSGAVAKSPKEAAIQLVRLEFDMSRLETAIAQADRRAGVHRTELTELRRRRTALLAMIEA